MDVRYGVNFPLVGGARASTPTAIGIVADAARVADPELADRIESATSWRSDYVEYFAELTALSADPWAAVAIATAGLDSMRRRIRILDGGSDDSGRETALCEAATVDQCAHSELRLAGSTAPADRLEIPYRGAVLAGSSLRDQLKRWREVGVVEPGFVSSIELAIDNPDILRVPGRRVALVGAAAEMGPLEALTMWGADVLALDVPVPRVWERIRAIASVGAGTVTVPVCGETPGIDIVREPMEAVAWILGQTSPTTGLVFGMHAYADGGEHVLLSAAADTIGGALSRERDTALAYLGTPTDSYLVPGVVMDDSRRRWDNRSALLKVTQEAARALTGGGVFRPAYAADHDGDDWGVADVMIPIQGPNYALAKRMQRWRSIAVASRGGLASFNVAPASWTASVTKNRVFNVAYSGASHFGVEIFPADTARWLMAAKLAADLATEPSAGESAHPEALMYADANHGGFWRTAYEPKSVLGVAALAGLPTTVVQDLRARI